MRGTRVALLLLLASLTSVAAELTPMVQDKRLGPVAAGVPFPASLDKELTSGLTNRVLLRIMLMEDARLVRQKAVEIAIRYDLWDENFTASTTVDNVVVASRNHLTHAQVHTMLAGIELPQLFPPEDLAGVKELTLRADILLNPVEHERLAAIRKWVTDNSAYVPMEAGPGPTALSGSSLSNAIFNRIFERYAGGADVAAPWQQTFASRPFLPGTLSDAGK
jgi:hypothetical protein